jgi:deazaflavin-dependent oxidoreductase (nitroreductase family)
MEAHMSKTINPTENQESSGFHIAMKILGTLHRWLYRASRGKLGKTFSGSPILLLTTTGRKTGRSRTWPLTYLREEGNHFVVAAAYGGQPTHPAWYHNLRANPRVVVQHGEQTLTMIAEVAEGDERSRLWARLTEAYPAYADYQRKTERQIPVVVLRQTA